MSFLDELSFGFGAKLPVILQTEAAECGIACLAMVSCYYENRIDLATLRRQHSISLKGATLADIIRIADHLQLATRPLKLELEDIAKLRRPCILHWNFNHFVVLKEINGKFATVHDPAFGVRKLSLSELSDSFTGVALELWPNTGFKKKNELRKVTIRELMGRVTGLFHSFGQVLLLALGLEVFTLVSPFFLQWVVDQAVVSADRDLLTTLALGFGLLMVMRVLIGAVRSWVVMHMGTTLNIQWRANVFTHLMRLPVQYFQKRHIGDIQSRFGSIDQVQATVTTSFIEAILDGVMSVATLTMMYLYSPLLASIALGTMVLYGLSRWAWYGQLRLAQHSIIVFAAKQETHFLESVRGARTIKLFQREEQRRSTWLSILVDQINAGLRMQKLQVIYGSFNSFLTGLETIIVISLGARMVLEGNFSVGVLMAFKAYNDQFSMRLSTLIDRILDFQLLKVHGERLGDIVLTEPERAYGSNPTVDAAQRTADITVSNLHFRYAEHEPFVLKGVNFQIQAGESVAIVGPSGCGKTTLMNAMLGVLPPIGGDVTIGGTNLRNLGVDAVREIVGTVMQDDALFAGSIADNISFFDPQADRTWIEECAKMAAVHDDIVAMPMGYNSLVGDMGTILSGGQKQRVLIARALYKRPKILFLDEATSHLDTEREQQVNASIKAMNITRLIIAHRPETIASADRVLSLSDGKITADSPRAKTAAVTSILAPKNPAIHESASGPSLPLAPTFMRLPTK